jgi:hypothetical protein
MLHTRRVVTVVMLSACLAIVVPAAQGAPSPSSRSSHSQTRVIQNWVHYRVAPSHYINLACIGVGATWLNDMHWRYWHRLDARGHGTLVTWDCDCNGPSRYPVRFHVTRARTDHHHFVFHHVSIRFTGKRPQHAHYYRELPLADYPIYGGV